MKKFKLFHLFLLAIIIVVLAACGSEGSSSTKDTSNEGSSESSSNEAENVEKIVLRTSSGVPEESILFKGVFAPWMEAVVEKTNGQVEFELYTGGELVSMGDEVNALESGLIDLALPIFNLYDQSSFPLSEVTMLPVAKSDPEIATKAYATLMYGDNVLKDGKTFYDLEYGDKNLHVWSTPLADAYALSTTGDPIESIDELKSMRLRTPTRLIEFFTNNLGATPITMPQVDVFEALNRGAIDGNFIAVTDWKSYGYHDLFTYTLEGANLGHFSAVFGMTKDKWESLPENVQTALDEASKDLMVNGEFANILAEINDEIRQLATDNGAIFENVADKPADIKDAVQNAMADTWYEWIEKVEQEGHPGREAAKVWRDAIIEAGGEIPEGLDID